MAINEGFNKMDNFGKPLPNFNIKGKDRTTSIIGGFISLVLYCLVLMYSLLKFSHLMIKKGPTVSSYFKEDNIEELAVNLNETNFKIAFTIESYL